MVLPKPWQLGLAVGAVAGRAFERCGVAEGFGCGLVGGNGLEAHFAGLAVAGLDGVDDAGADIGGDGQAVDQDEDGLGEVEFEQRLRGGELDDLSTLEEAVIAATAEFGEAVFQRIGYVDDRWGGCGFGLLRGELSRLGWRESFDDCDAGTLQGLELDLRADDGEERVGACAFGLREQRGDDLVDRVALDDTAAV